VRASTGHSPQLDLLIPRSRSLLQLVVVLVVVAVVLLLLLRSAHRYSQSQSRVCSCCACNNNQPSIRIICVALRASLSGASTPAWKSCGSA
jgi:hypothetical protein